LEFKVKYFFARFALYTLKRQYVDPKSVSMYIRAGLPVVLSPSGRKI